MLNKQQAWKNGKIRLYSTVSLDQGLEVRIVDLINNEFGIESVGIILESYIVEYSLPGGELSVSNQYPR